MAAWTSKATKSSRTRCEPRQAVLGRAGTSIGEHDLEKPRQQCRGLCSRLCPAAKCLAYDPASLPGFSFGARTSRSLERAKPRSPGHQAGKTGEACTVALRCDLRTSAATIAPHQKPNPKRTLIVAKRGDLENAPRAAARARSRHGGIQVEFPDDQFGGKARLQHYDPGNRRSPGGNAFSGELAGHRRTCAQESCNQRRQRSQADAGLTCPASLLDRRTSASGPQDRVLPQ